MRTALAFLVLLTIPFTASRAQTRDDGMAAYTEAFGALYVRKDYPAYRDAMRRVVAARPDDANALYDLAGALALTGDSAEALRTLDRVVARGVGFDPSLDPRFTALANLPEYKKLLERVVAGDPPRNRSRVAFTIAERDLIPEGIAYDPVTGATFVGSLAKSKIVRIDKSGVASDFTASKQDGLWAVLGMKVDAKRRQLLVCSAAGASTGADDGRSGLFVFNLETGKLVRKHLVDTAAGKHLFNDLALAPGGEAYVTDSLTGAVYRVDPTREAPEVWMPADTFIYPNGIAMSEDGSKLFVASEGRGVTRIEVKTRAMADVATGTVATLTGIDGLYVYGRDLVAVRNGLGPGRAVRALLNAAMDRVERVDVLESRHPRFEIPTTGTLVGDRLRFIANSQLRRLKDDGTIPDSGTLKETVILDVAIR
jgi:sugar lactone lactonase YvrE